VGQTVVGIDEHTALMIDCATANCEVLGLGTVTVLQKDGPRVIASGETFSLDDLGRCRLPDLQAGIPSDIWPAAQEAAKRFQPEGVPVPPQEVLDLVEQRQSARISKDWRAADRFRDQIAALGWLVQDTPEGPVVSKQ
jgi:hypothetical protein